MNKFKLWMKRLLLYGMVAPIALLIVSFIAWIVFVWARNMHTASVPRSEFKEISVEEIEDLIFPGDIPDSEKKKLSGEEKIKIRNTSGFYSEQIDFEGAKEKLKGQYFCLNGNIFMLNKTTRCALLISDKYFELCRFAIVICHLSERSDVDKLDSGPWLARVKVYGKCTSMFFSEKYMPFSIINLYGISVDAQDQHQYSEYTAKELLKLKQQQYRIFDEHINYIRKCKFENKSKLKRLKKSSSDETEEREELYEDEIQLTPEQEKESHRQAVRAMEFLEKYFGAPDYLKITGTITDIKSVLPDKIMVEGCDEDLVQGDRKLIMQCKGVEGITYDNEDYPKVPCRDVELEFTVWPLLKKMYCFTNVYEEFYRKKVGDTVTVYVNLNDISDLYNIMYFEEVSPEQKALAEEEAKYPEPVKSESKGK